MTIHITIEREKNTPTPGKSPRYRARLRAAPDGPPILISASNFGSVSRAKASIEDFFAGRFEWRESAEPDTRATAEIEL
jgi:hypothetical protein